MEYSNDRATQIVVTLLKAHKIKRVIASPGTTNIALVGSMQYDSWFEIYSSADERSAAYMACGMAEATGEPVVITCTGATASRNYLPGLTEAFYRKLPILAITGSHGDETIGHLRAQDIDRTQAPKDAIKMSVFIDRICSEKDEWATITNVNKAILELTRYGGGPVHINLRLGHGAGFTTKELPTIRKISRYTYNSTLPDIKGERVAIFLGSHKPFNNNEIEIIDKFCECYNGVVFNDLTSRYCGKYGIRTSLIASQHIKDVNLLSPELTIHIGEISGEFYTTYSLKSDETWRISEDGEIRDLFGNLTAVFQMSEMDFFTHYTSMDNVGELTFYNDCKNKYSQLIDRIPNLPFGNLWIAHQIHDKLPKDSFLYVSIFNSLRSWNFFDIAPSIKTSCNVGGFGIDGPLSTLLGSAIVKKDVIHYAVVGDLAFFYDMNVLGNRHISSNIRILLINNGVGTEFRNYDHPANQWGEDANLYMAAAGHYGNKSINLVKHYSEDLGFIYLSASSKKDFLDNVDLFLNPDALSKPVLFEIFTDSKDESDALRLLRSITQPPKPSIKDRLIAKSNCIINKLNPNGKLSL